MNVNVIGILWEQMCLLTKQMDELKHAEPQMKPYLAEAKRHIEKAVYLMGEAKFKLEQLQGAEDGNDE
jgi:hypothetical protein